MWSAEAKKRSLAAVTMLIGLTVCLFLLPSDCYMSQAQDKTQPQANDGVRRLANYLEVREFDVSVQTHVLAEWEAWAWKQAFPNPNEEIKRLINAQRLEDMLHLAKNAFERLENVPPDSLQEIALAMTIKYLRVARPQMQGCVAVSLGAKDGIPWVRDAGFWPSNGWVDTADFTAVKIGGTALGIISCELKATVVPSGILDLFQTNQEPVSIDGSVLYELIISMGSAKFSSCCKQRWYLEVDEGRTRKFDRKLAEKFQ